MGELRSRIENPVPFETTLLWRPIKGNLSDIYRDLGLIMKFNLEGEWDDYFRISTYLGTLGHIGRGMDEFHRFLLKGELEPDGTLEVGAEDLLEAILNQAETAVSEEKKGAAWERNVSASTSLVNWLGGKGFKVVFEFMSDEGGVNYSQVRHVSLVPPPFEK